MLEHSCMLWPPLGLSGETDGSPRMFSSEPGLKLLARTELQGRPLTLIQGTELGYLQKVAILPYNHSLCSNLEIKRFGTWTGHEPMQNKKRFNRRDPDADPPALAAGCSSSRPPLGLLWPRRTERDASGPSGGRVAPRPLLRAKCLPRSSHVCPAGEVSLPGVSSTSQEC